MIMVAVRNIDLCSKDCLCLYVCPNGATDTENSIIDVDKCTGGGMCIINKIFGFINNTSLIKYSCIIFHTPFASSPMKNAPEHTYMPYLLTSDNQEIAIYS